MQRYIVHFPVKIGIKETIGRLSFQYNTLEKKVKRLERDVKSLETELEDLNECVNMKTMVNLIQEIVLSIIAKKVRIPPICLSLLKNLIWSRQL